MSIYTPYTYLVTFLPTGQRYYGSRTKQECSPADLWKSYYTSSKLVRQLIEQHGKDSFKVEIRRTFQTKEAALLWEHRVLRRINAARNPQYLNKNNGDRKFLPKTNHSSETKAKIGTKSKGRTMSKESIEKMLKTRQERFGDTPPWLSSEANQKRSEANKQVPWNKGLTGWNKGRVPWNKGLTAIKKGP